MRQIVPLPAKRMLTDEEAADYCGFKTVKQYTDHARSRVPAIDFGTYHRWDRCRLDEWLDTLSSSVKETEVDIVATAFKKPEGGRNR